MTSLTFEISFIMALLLANGLFAMVEIAVVAARKTRLKTMIDEGHRGAKLALSLANSPGKFLSTVQVGITLVGILAGAIGGANIAKKIAPLFAEIPLLSPYADPLSLLIVVVLITYFSVIIGELVPKRIALNNPERIASALARPMKRLASLFSPLDRKSVV